MSLRLLVLADPAITAIKSTLAAGNEQGQIIGAISAVQGIAGGLGPAVFNGLYSMSLDDAFKAGLPLWLATLAAPATVWWTGAALMMASVLLALTVPDPRPLRAQQEREKDPTYNPVRESLRIQGVARLTSLEKMDRYALKEFGHFSGEYQEIHRRLVLHQMQLDNAKGMAPDVDLKDESEEVDNPYFSSGSGKIDFDGGAGQAGEIAFDQLSLGPRARGGGGGGGWDDGPQARRQPAGDGGDIGVMVYPRTPRLR